MNIGGRALRNGIVLESDNFSVKTIRDKNGNIDIDVDELEDDKTANLFENIPILRGIIDYFQYKINIIIIILLIILDILHYKSTSIKPYLLISNSLTLIVNICFICFILYLAIYCKRFLQYHGAEHKVVNTYEANQKIAIDNVKKADRRNRRCGTIYAIFLIATLILLNILIQWFSISFLIAVGVSYELFISNRLENGILNFMYKIGSWLQKYITTLEPNDNQLEVAIVCMNKVLELEESFKTT